MTIKDYRLDVISNLESESIYILRETAAQFENPALLFSGGKDSIVILHLAIKAFYPGKIPFSLLHVDTGHNFAETIKFRDALIEKYALNLHVASVQDAIDRGFVIEESGMDASRNALQTEVLLEAINKLKIDAAIGGARRDEEKARAKERIYSHRDEFGQWQPRNQRAELWNLFNPRKGPLEHFRIFPISNWTELDVWNYIEREQITLPSLYFAHKRKVIKRADLILATADFMNVRKEDEIVEMEVRCRTIGDITCTGMYASGALTVGEIIKEIAVTRTTERGGRADDQRSETSMEDRKKLGYF